MTYKIPQPHHRWAANEDMYVRAFGLRDCCLSCGVKRYHPGPSGSQSNAVAATACPGRPWRELPDDDLAARITEAHLYAEDET